MGLPQTWAYLKLFNLFHLFYASISIPSSDLNFSDPPLNIFTHTFMHIHSGMIDAAKYADLVLLLIDGGFGFEMETFEFLNLLQVRAGVTAAGCTAIVAASVRRSTER